MPLRSTLAVSEIEAVIEAGSKRASLVLELLSPDGSPSWKVPFQPVEGKPNTVRAEVEKTIASFKISAEHLGIWKSGKVEVKNLRIYGLSIEETNDAIEAVGHRQEFEARFNAEAQSQLREIAARSAEIKKAEQQAELERKQRTEKLKEIEGQVTQAESRLVKINSDIEKSAKLEVAASERLEKLQEELTTSKEIISAHEQQLQQLLLNISQKDSDLKLKMDHLAHLNEEVRTLQNDKSLFAENMAGFKSQGYEQIQTNLSIVSPCIFFGLIFAALTALGLYNFIDVYLANAFLGVQNLLLAKLPLALFMSTVFTVLFKFVKPYLAEIRRIHEGRLRLSEISILAQDVSDSMLHGLNDVADSERLQLKYAVKMELIKRFFTGEFKQEGGKKELDRATLQTWTRPSILSGIWSRLKPTAQ